MGKADPLHRDRRGGSLRYGLDPTMQLLWVPLAWGSGHLGRALWCSEPPRWHLQVPAGPGSCSQELRGLACRSVPLEAGNGSLAKFTCSWRGSASSSPDSLWFPGCIPQLRGLLVSEARWVPGSVDP